MRAVQINGPGMLALAEVAEPVPGPGQVLVRVRACGVCRTDLHELDGEVAIPHPPVIPGHQIVGTVLECESGAFAPGARVGIPWLGWACGVCAFCLRGEENLCVRARFTGRDIDGGYAELAVADERFCFPIPRALRGPRGGAAAVRRADRLPRAAPRGRGRARGAVRIRRLRAHRRPGGESGVSPGVRVHAPG